MFKRSSTPLSKDRVPSKNSYNLNKPSKDLKNIQSKPSLSRMSTNSKLSITP